jgi:hypothetical protein
MEVNGFHSDLSFPSWQGDPPHNYSIWAYAAVCGSLGVGLLLTSLATYFRLTSISITADNK